MSTRRILKGPGHRPKSLARRRFMELLNKGVSTRADCREIGVCRQTGQNWKNRVTVIRKNRPVKHVPPLHPLSTRLISPAFYLRLNGLLSRIFSVRGWGRPRLDPGLVDPLQRLVVSCAVTRMHRACIDPLMRMCVPPFAGNDLKPQS